MASSGWKPTPLELCYIAAVFILVGLTARVLGIHRFLGIDNPWVIPLAAGVSLFGEGVFYLIRDVIRRWRS